MHSGDDACPDATALADLHYLQQRTNPPSIISPGGTQYLISRRRLVNWVANVCTRFRLKPLTVHVAVQHMDRASETEPQLKHFALAAIALAAKMEESPDSVPLVSELQCVEGTFHPQVMQEFELKIMKALDWRLQACTYLHFLNIHINQGVLCPFDVLNGRPVLAKEESYLIKYIFFFADICVLESDFLHYAAGLTSAAIIAAARYTVGIEPVWPPELYGKTSYSADDIANCMSSVLRVFCRDYPASVPPMLRSKLQIGSPTTTDVLMTMDTREDGATCKANTSQVNLFAS